MKSTICALFGVVRYPVWAISFTTNAYVAETLCWILLGSHKAEQNVCSVPTWASLHDCHTVGAGAAIVEAYNTCHRTPLE